MKKYLSLFTFFICFSISAQDTYLHCGKIIDTESGKVLTNKTIIVSSDKIIAIKNGYISSENPLDKEIDLKSKTVMPGLIDLHVHIESEFNPQKYMNAFTANDADIAFGSLKFVKGTGKLASMYGKTVAEKAMYESASKYRIQLAKPYLKNKEFDENMLTEAYDRMKQDILSLIHI